VRKYDTIGNLIWSRQLGFSSGDDSFAASSDGFGNVVIAGSLLGDAFVAKYNAAGDLQWTQQLGTPAYEAARGVSADQLGNVYLAGRTDGNLVQPIGGTIDAFIARYSDTPIPEPSTSAMLVAAVIATCLRVTPTSRGKCTRLIRGRKCP
jgi:hypothetical protein